jgi:hypothetical protein
MRSWKYILRSMLSVEMDMMPKNMLINIPTLFLTNGMNYCCSKENTNHTIDDAFKTYGLH